MTTPTKPRIGRPPVPAEQRRVSVTFRVLPEVREKALRLGRERLEALIHRAKEPATKEN